MASSEEGSERSWSFLGNRVPKSEIQYFGQIIILYTVILVSIGNLSLGHKNSELWTALLASCLGYLLPNPSLKKHVLPHPA